MIPRSKLIILSYSVIDRLCLNYQEPDLFIVFLTNAVGCVPHKRWTVQLRCFGSLSMELVSIIIRFPESLVKSLRYWTNNCCRTILPPDFLQSVLITSLDCKSIWMEFSVICFQKILYWLRFIFSQSPFWFVFGLRTLYLTWIACLAWEDLSYPEIIKKILLNVFSRIFM